MKGRWLGRGGEWKGSLCEGKGMWKGRECGREGEEKGREGVVKGREGGREGEMVVNGRRNNWKGRDVKGRKGR